MTDDAPRRYVAECCEALGIDPADLFGKAKTDPRLCQARQAVTWATRERFPEYSWAKLGRLLRRDHSTLIHSTGVFRAACAIGEEWALELRAELTSKVTPLEGLETALESLCSGMGPDLSEAIEIGGADGI